MGEFQALGWDVVTTPAGRFRAVKIFCYGWGFTEQYWYAPDVGFWVKFEGSRGYSEELLAVYRVAPGQ